MGIVELDRVVDRPGSIIGTMAEILMMMIMIINPHPATNDYCPLDPLIILFLFLFLFLLALNQTIRQFVDLALTDCTTLLYLKCISHYYKLHTISFLPLPSLLFPPSFLHQQQLIFKNDRTLLLRPLIVQQ